MPHVHRSERNGVPIFWAEAPPPFTAALVFRVGRADETLRTAGVTHLVEHLAFPIEDRPQLELNGMVDHIETAFWASGSRERVRSFVSEISSALSALPVERLETERRILTTEAASAGMSLPGALSALRFGPTGQGLLGYDEYGLNRLGEGEVTEWARDRFTADGCALWLSGAPDDLEVALPRGGLHPPPEPEHIDGLELPSAYGAGPSGHVAVSFLARRSHAISIAGTTVERRARQQLRYKLGKSYSVELLYLPLTATNAHLMLIADCLDRDAPRVRDALLGVLDAVAADGPTDEERHDDLERMQATDDPQLVLGALSYAASAHLLGQPFQTHDELTRERATVASSAVAEALADALRTMLLAVPDAVDVPGGRFTPYPERPRESIRGRRHGLRGLAFRKPLTLVAGPEGVALEAADGPVTRVRFADCVGALKWPTGTRGLWSRDGFYVEIDPDEWRGGKDVVRLIDAHVAPDVVIPMEPDLAARVAHVAQTAEAQVKRRWMTSDELDALPHHLDDGEHVLIVAEATKGLRAGLLVLTDRRLLFLFLNDVVLDVPYASVTAAREERSLWSSRKLVVEANGERHGFGEVKPKERLAEVLGLLGERAGGRSA